MISNAHSNKIYIELVHKQFIEFKLQINRIIVKLKRDTLSAYNTTNFP